MYGIDTNTHVLLTTYSETQLNFLRISNVTNSIMIHNLREMLLSKRNIVDADLADVTSISEILRLILKGNQLRHVGTITAKCHNIQL